MKIAITGARGFIGTNVCEALQEHHLLTRIDHKRVPGFGDAGPIENDPDQIAEKIDGNDVVIHLAANADVRSGWDDPTRDIERNTMLTASLLGAMKTVGIRRIVFASTGSVYHPSGPAHYHHEGCPVHATSLYAASKIAGEQLIAAYAAADHIDPTILRFVSVLGPHYSHGHVIDFVRKVKEANTAPYSAMEIMGSGFQHKGYVHVGDVADAVRNAATRNWQGTYNVATSSYATPMECAAWVAEALGEDVPKLIPTNQSWPGDNPNILLDCTSLREHGWRPKYTIEEAIKETALWVAGHQ